jgi:hypothetical protein
MRRCDGCYCESDRPIERPRPPAPSNSVRPVRLPRNTNNWFPCELGTPARNMISVTNGLDCNACPTGPEAATSPSRIKLPSGCSSPPTEAHKGCCGRQDEVTQSIEFDPQRTRPLGRRARSAHWPKSIIARGARERRRRVDCSGTTAACQTAIKSLGSAASP